MFPVSSTRAQFPLKPKDAQNSSVTADEPERRPPGRLTYPPAVPVSLSAPLVTAALPLSVPCAIPTESHGLRTKLYRCAKSGFAHARSRISDALRARPKMRKE